MSEKQRYETLVTHMGAVFAASDEARTDCLVRGLREIASTGSWTTIRGDSERLLEVWVAKEVDPAAETVSAQLRDLLQELESDTVPRLVISETVGPIQEEELDEGLEDVDVEEEEEADWEKAHKKPVVVELGRKRMIQPEPESEEGEEEEDAPPVVHTKPAVVEAPKKGGKPSPPPEPESEEGEEEEDAPPVVNKKPAVVEAPKKVTKPPPPSEEEAPVVHKKPAVAEAPKKGGKPPPPESEEDEAPPVVHKKPAVVEAPKKASKPPPPPPEPESEEDEEAGVIPFTYQGRSYWLDESDQTLYEHLGDDKDPGDAVSKLVNGRPRAFATLK